MINGRGISKENIWALKKNLTRLYVKQVRISQQIKEINTILSGEDSYTEPMCWSCKQHGDTTDLTFCELSNTLYPVACNEFNPMEKE